ncbi:MAG: TcdA/TcdB catalytic glycosyltransferase domain-containing protein [Myxococcota bacterium]
MLPSSIHLIWLGSSVPNDAQRPYRKYIGQWKTLNPNWSVCLWVNPKNLSVNDLKTLHKWASQNGLNLHSIESFCHDLDLGPALCDTLHEKRYASASDILRVLILNSEGGLYVDTDVSPATLSEQSIPRGIGLVIKYDGHRLRSVLPHAMIMARGHPFASLIIEQLKFNFETYTHSNFKWKHSTRREFQYAATVSVTGTAWTLLLLRLKEEELTRSRLMPFQFPYVLQHQEHNSWLKVDTTSNKTWRPQKYLASQRNWALRQSKVTDLHRLKAHFTQCTIGG